ncbi:MAG: hypothetical protein ACXADF_15015 [Candidatus Thorarchaeota archaeon]|jgi:hypothetical protein
MMWNRIRTRLALRLLKDLTWGQGFATLSVGYDYHCGDPLYSVYVSWERDGQFVDKKNLEEDEAMDLINFVLKSRGM